MDVNEKNFSYIKKNPKVINAIYVLGKYFDPDSVILQIERLSLIAGVGLGIGLFCILII